MIRQNKPKNPYVSKVNVTCCGKPMLFVDSGIYECADCECYVHTAGGTITKRRNCRAHGGR